MCIYTHHEYSVLDITCVYVRDLGPFVCTFTNFFCEFMWVKRIMRGFFGSLCGMFLFSSCAFSFVPKSALRGKKEGNDSLKNNPLQELILKF